MKSLLLIAPALLPQTIAKALCSCSPTEYTFRINLLGNCDTAAIEKQDGITDSECSFKNLSQVASPGEITKVTSIVFLELNEELDNSINQDGTYFTTDLSDGSVISYTSVSNQLDPSLPLEDQMQYVPTSVTFMMFGTDKDGNMVRNVVAWDYGCVNEPLSVGSSIGWLELVS